MCNRLVLVLFFNVFLLRVSCCKRADWDAAADPIAENTCTQHLLRIECPSTPLASACQVALSMGVHNCYI